MRTQLQAISLRIQTVRSNEQMMQSMKGATALLGSMNRQMNLPALQRIAMEFEKENDVMDQRQEMMDDAIDDVTGVEDEEEGEEVVQEVMDELGVDLGQAVSFLVLIFPSIPTAALLESRAREGERSMLMCVSVNSLEKRRRDYRKRPSPREGLPRPLAADLEAEAEAAAAAAVTMIYRHVWTAYGDERRASSQCRNRSIIPGP